jgi:hypothetical protein
VKKLRMQLDSIGNKSIRENPMISQRPISYLFIVVNRCPRGLNREQREGEEGTGRRKEIFFYFDFFNYYFRDEFMRCFF